ncbi:MAG: ABC transporter substrate-binding protein, partial [candidate division NC10 bacterium]|nr:ABC transporter substrate-binding protein [candidate division NC10 bacterium]
MRQRWVVGALVLAAAVALAVGPADAASKLIRLTFYYPVGVAGPLAKVIGE